MDCFVASLPCANASRLSQAMAEEQQKGLREMIAQPFVVTSKPCSRAFSSEVDTGSHEENASK
jgi:hypothetical protein